jgi:hypothetical protein
VFLTRLQGGEVGTPDPCPDFNNSDCAVTIRICGVGGTPVFEGPGLKSWPGDCLVEFTAVFISMCMKHMAQCLKLLTLRALRRIYTGHYHVTPHGLVC